MKISDFFKIFIWGQARVESPKIMVGDYKWYLEAIPVNLTTNTEFSTFLHCTSEDKLEFPVNVNGKLLNSNSNKITSKIIMFFLSLCCLIKKFQF